MYMISLLAALILLQDPPGDKEGEAAVRKLKEDFTGATLERKAAIVAEALAACPQEKLIKAVGELLHGEADSVRLPAVQALSDVDHPASVEALVAALPANARRLEVASAIIKALGELGWQSACPVLHEQLRHAAQAEVREYLPLVLDALGRIGNPASIDVVADFLESIEGPRRDPWPNLGPIRRSAENALRDISGAQFRKAEEWKSWWRAGQEIMKGRAVRSYWLKKTHERVAAGPAEKTPSDALLVGIRISTAKEAPRPRKRKKP